MSGRFELYTWGLLAASVCTDLPDDVAAVHLNLVHPTGISSGWAISADDFHDGTPNGSPCPDREGCRHVLFEC